MDRQEFVQRYMHPLNGELDVPVLAEAELEDFSDLCARLGYVSFAGFMDTARVSRPTSWLLRQIGTDEKRLRDRNILAGPYVLADLAGRLRQYTGFMLYEQPAGDSDGDRPETA